VDDAVGDVIIYQCWKSCLFVAAGNYGARFCVRAIVVGPSIWGLICFLGLGDACAKRKN